MEERMIKRRINLIPGELQLATSINLRKLLTVWILLVILIFFAISVVQKAYVLKYRNQIARQNIESQILLQQKLELEEKIAELKMNLPKRDELEGIAGMVRKILSDYTLPSDILRELSFMVPPDIWVTRLSLSRETEKRKDRRTIQYRKLTIEGVALNQQSLADILTNLESHPWFKEIKLDFVEREEDRYEKEVFDFLIEGRLKERVDEG